MPLLRYLLVLYDEGEDDSRNRVHRCYSLVSMKSAAALLVIVASGEVYFG